MLPTSITAVSPFLRTRSPTPPLTESLPQFYLTMAVEEGAALRCETTTDSRVMSEDRTPTPCPIFKNAMAELGRLLIYEASRDWLPTRTGEIQTPVAIASVEFIDPREPVAIVPILRAGLALAEHASSILPVTKTYHLGISRNEETFQPTVYLNKLPDKFPDGSRIFLVDPMLATGGTVVAALDLIKKRGVKNSQIKVISAVASPPALQRLSEKFPGLQVYAATVDPKINEKGFIIPGLGDAGDRSFGT